MARAEKEPDQSRLSGRLAKRVRMLRKQRRLTHDQFYDALQAAGLNIGRSTTYAWENGSAGFKLDHLPAIAKALGVSLHELMPAK